MSLPVVLRVKKRKLPTGSGAAVGTAEAPNAAEAAVRLLLAPVDGPAKRPRVAAGGESGGGIFVFAGRVSSAEAALAEATVRRAIGKRKLDGEAEQLRRRLGERPSEGEGRLVYKRRRRVDPTPVRPLSTAAPAVASTADVADCRFRIVDFEAGGPTQRPAAGEEPIACNGVAMTTTDGDAANDADEDVYYDVYYGYCDGDVGAWGDCGGRPERQQQLQYILQAYEEAYRYGDDGDAGPGGFAVEDAGSDSDSNSESNWRNDYPDTPDGSSEEDGGESDDDADDVDPYDDHDSHGVVGGLAGRLRGACIASDSDDDGDGGGGGDDAAAELRDWRSFKRQLLLGSAAQPEPQQDQQTTDNK